MKNNEEYRQNIILILIELNVVEKYSHFEE